MCIAVIHREEICGEFALRVDRLWVNRRAFVEQHTAVVLVVVETLDLGIHIAVLFTGARRVELLDVEIQIDDRLEEVQRPGDVRVDCLVGPIPGFADVGLGRGVKHDLLRVLRQRRHRLLDGMSDLTKPVS